MRLLIPALAMLLTGCNISDMADWGDMSRYQEDFKYTYPLKAGGRVTLENYNGSVEVTGWDKNEVEVAGQKYAATKNLLDQLKVDVRVSENQVDIKTVRPDGLSRRGNAGARYVLRVPKAALIDPVQTSNGGITIRDLEGRVNLRTTNGTVRGTNLKESVEVQTSNGSVELREVASDARVRTTNGRISAEDLHGGLQAETTNGAISAMVANSVAAKNLRLETTNGSIDVRVQSPLKGDLRAATTNGSITVRVPPELNAHVNAHTSNSTVSTDFNVPMPEERSKRKSINATIGTGGPMVELSTTNGSIRLLKSS